MDRQEERLREALQRMAPDADGDEDLRTVVQKGRVMRRRRRLTRAGTAVLAVVLVAAVAFGVVRLAQAMNNDPNGGGGWSSMGAPAAGSDSTASTKPTSATDSTTTSDITSTTISTAETTSTLGPTTTIVSPPTSVASAGAVVYTNTDYGFTFALPSDWAGFTIQTTEWQGSPVDSSSSSSEPNPTGPQIQIRNPRWTEADPYQDIPIMVFTLEEWNLVTQDELSVSAAPIPPSELGRNSKYVFALPARYNYACPTGWEEVETILKGHPLQPTEPQS